MLDERIVCAGFGGQGVMLIGQLITYAGMYEDKEVSWLPSYGPEMRGGTANCSVMVSDKPISSPVIANNATAALVMNLPSMDKFEGELLPNGKLLVNSSLIDKKATRTDIKAYYIPCNEIAAELGNNRVANMVMLGAYIELTKVVEPKDVIKALEYIFGPTKSKLIPINEKAIEAGAKVVRK